MAGGSMSRGRGGAITGINVTPLVDITLVLLIIFMVTAKLIVNKDALTVDLPKAATGSEVQEILSIVLAPGDVTHVNGASVASDEALASAAKASFAKDKTVRAVLKADGTVPHARVMRVLDLLRLTGISKVAFGVVPDGKSKEKRQ
jgi:biopolymer transport protein ExbD